MKSVVKNSIPVRVAIEYVRLDSLVLDVDNPRQHSRKQVKDLAAGIREFGFLVPVVIDDAYGVIAGHARTVAAKQLGLSEVPAIRVRHLSASQLKAYRLADNKISTSASWDERLLAKELMELIQIDLDFPVSLTGFSTAEIDILIERQKVKSVDCDDPTAWNGLPVCRAGDIWTLDRHRVLCGDGTASASMERLMQGEVAEVVFVDPPFNVRIEGNVSGKGKVKHRDFEQAAGELSAEQFRDFLRRACSNLAAHSRDGAIVFVCMDWRHSEDVLLIGKETFSELKNISVWVKDNPGLGSFYRSGHEFVFVFKSGNGPHINNIELGKYGRNRSNVWHYDSAATSARKGQDVFDLHPTVKPLPMVIDAIMDTSNRGGIVLDSFLGSGTTLLAAEHTGRIFRGIELDARYVDTAIRRWQIATGKDAIREDGQTFLKLEHELAR